MHPALTERARAALDAASDEARIRHQQVGSPHLLLGLIADDAGRAVTVLRSLGFSVGDVRAEALRKIGRPVRRVRRGFRPPLSARVGAALVAADEEARRAGAEVVDEEHLLLALLADREGKAAQLLDRLRAQAS